MQLVSAMVLMVAGVTGNGSGDLEWTTHYGQARETAKQAKRPLLIVMEDPEKPNAKFDDRQLASESGQKDLLQKYLLCRVDVTTPYGKKVAEAFHAKKFPYTAITDKSATYITFRGAGNMKPNDWNEALDEHKEGEMPERVVTFKPATQSVQSDATIVQPYVVQPQYSQPAAQPSYNFSFPSFSSGST